MGQIKLFKYKDDFYMEPGSGLRRYHWEMLQRCERTDQVKALRGEGMVEKTGVTT